MIAPLAVAAALGGGAAQGGPDAEVLIAAGRFTPPRVSLLVGESLAWHNRDHRSHTVTARGTFDSGGLAAGDTFVHRFDRAGTFPYVCTIHRVMRGTVEVATLALAAPDSPVPAGERVSLVGRAPAGTGVVTLERDGVRTAEAAADPDGRFAFSVLAERPAGYRARAGALASAAAHLAVAPELRLEARRHGRSVSVRVHVPAGQPGARVVIERYRRERFGFVRARRRALRLDRHSRARAVIRLRAGVRLRARVAVPTGGWARSISPEVHVGRGTHLHPRGGPG